MKSNVSVSMNMTISQSASIRVCRCVFLYTHNHVNDLTQMTGKIIKNLTRFSCSLKTKKIFDKIF